MPRWRRAASDEVEPPAAAIDVRALTEADRPWADEVELHSWGERQVVRLGERVDPTVLPGFVAWLGGERAGLLAYAIRGDECEVVTVTSLQEGLGIARALLDAVRDAAVAARCRRIWLTTTNDNLRALAVYQRWGMDIAALHRHAVTEARRRLKPSIPERGASGIPIAHELELELRLH
jgi:ribosomal protein S18 acetylase RimI-like enzyme